MPEYVAIVVMSIPTMHCATKMASHIVEKLHIDEARSKEVWH
jgi:hypothetical protein